jgi:hypothetical protein
VGGGSRETHQVARLTSATGIDEDGLWARPGAAALEVILGEEAEQLALLHLDGWGSHGGASEQRGGNGGEKLHREDRA